MYVPDVECVVDVLLQMTAAAVSTARTRKRMVVQDGLRKHASRKCVLQ